MIKGNNNSWFLPYVTQWSHNILFLSFAVDMLSGECFGKTLLCNSEVDLDLILLYWQSYEILSSQSSPSQISDHNILGQYTLNTTSYVVH